MSDENEMTGTGEGREAAQAPTPQQAEAAPDATATREHLCTLKTGITRTREFEKKGLASYAVNCGVKCGHGCRYCSTGAMLRMG